MIGLGFLRIRFLGLGFGLMKSQRLEEESSRTILPVFRSEGLM